MVEARLWQVLLGCQCFLFRPPASPDQQAVYCSLQVTIQFCHSLLHNIHWKTKEALHKITNMLSSPL